MLSAHGLLFFLGILGKRGLLLLLAYSQPLIFYSSSLLLLVAGATAGSCFRLA